MISLGLTGSVLARRPAIGFLLETLMSVPVRWWRHDRVRPALSEWTLVRAACALVEAFVYLLLIVAGKGDALLAVSLAFGYPVFGALVFGGWRYVRARPGALDGPPFETVAKAQAAQSS